MTPARSSPPSAMSEASGPITASASKPGWCRSVPAPVVAQVSRSARQVQLRRLLRGCAVLPLDDRLAHDVGRLLGRSGTTDIVDATVVTMAIAAQAQVVTGDLDDISRLARTAGARLDIIES